MCRFHTVHVSGLNAISFLNVVFLLLMCHCVLLYRKNAGVFFTTVSIAAATHVWLVSIKSRTILGLVTLLFDHPPCT